MRLELDYFVDSHPGLEQGGPVTDRLRISPSEGFLGYFPLNLWAMARSWKPLGCQYAGHSFEVLDHTQTLNSGTVAMGAGGLVFTTAAASSETVQQSKVTYTPAAGQYWKGAWKVASTTAATCGLVLGFCATGDTSPIASDATDGVWFNVGSASAVITARVRGNSGTASDQATFVVSNDPATAYAAVSLVDVTDMELGMEFFFGSTAALSWGAFWVNGYRTPFTAAQVTQLFAILTTPPALARYEGILGDGSARVATFRYMLGGATEN